PLRRDHVLGGRPSLRVLSRNRAKSRPKKIKTREKKRPHAKVRRCREFFCVPLDTNIYNQGRRPMPLDFDATLKALLEESPADWPVLIGQPRSEVDVIDADISTVSGATDKVLRIHGPPESIMHIDFQSGADTTLPRRVHMYNAVLEYRHQL